MPGGRSQKPLALRVGAAALAVPVVAALSACGGTVVDDQKLEDQIKVTAPPGIVVRSVECPSDVDVDVGQKITCTVDLKGAPTRTLTYRILDKDANLALISNKPAKKKEK
jgi:hypothetical protein